MKTNEEIDKIYMSMLKEFNPIKIGTQTTRYYINYKKVGVLRAYLYEAFTLGLEKISKLENKE